MSKCAILGTGLIGASIGIGLRSTGHSVVGWDPDPDHVQSAAAIGAVDTTETDWRSAVAGADVVVLAGPTQATIETLALLSTDALVFDVAGVKGPIISAGAHLAHFVPSHPMAGRETSGPQGASGSLFRGASWVVVNDGVDDADASAVAAIVESLGAIPMYMSAEDHDVAVALASHVPHLTASALVSLVAGNPLAFELAAGGFRDLTRVAMSRAEWWPEVLVENREAVISGLRSLAAGLDGIAEELEAEDHGLIGARLAETGRIRRTLAAPVASVRLVLEDRPGQMALVGAALSASSVDLRDLQLRHATHGGGGVLTLSVNPDEADQLANALRMQGFQLLD